MIQRRAAGCQPLRPGRAMRLQILAFASGVGLLQTCATLPALPTTVGALLLAGVLILALATRRSVLARLFTCAACIVLGLSWASLRAEQRLRDYLPATWEGVDVQLVGVVATLPHAFERGERFEFFVESCETSGAVIPSRIALSWYRGRQDEEWQTPLNVRPGERWRFTVRLKRPHGNANPHGFDYEAWLFERNIRATGYVRPRMAAVRLHDLVLEPAYLIERWRHRLRQSFFDTMPAAPYVGILTALAIGDQQAIPAAQWRLFRLTGITHLMSISGLHVTMFAALLAGLAGWLWRRSEYLMLRVPAPKVAIAAGWCAAGAYALLSGFAVPTQRTFYMLTVVAWALWSARHLGLSRGLLLALLLVLLIDPWAVLAPGFWLSFAAVGLLFYVGSARVGATRGWRTALVQWGVTQWAVTVGTLPLLLLMFQQFSLVSPLANALAIPVVSFLITPLALLFAVFPWPPLLHLDHLLLSGLMIFLEWLANWPFWQQAAPPLATTLLALLGVVYLLLPRGFPARWVALCLLLPSLFLPVVRPTSGSAWIDVLDVGQGLGVVIRTAGHNLLYDAGPLYSAESDAGQRIIVPYLNAIGIERIDTLIVTHRDSDHSGGVLAVQNALPIERTLSSVAELPGEACAAGQTWEWDGVRFTILHPPPASYQQAISKTNHLSCVLRVETNSHSALLTSDIEALDEQWLLANTSTQLRNQVLLVPHHGSRSSSSVEFIRAVDPDEVIFPVGYRNRYQHPHPEIVERYAGRRLWRTDRDGALQVVLGERLEVSDYRAAYRRYWHGQ